MDTDHPDINCPRCGRKAKHDQEGVYCPVCEIDISELFD
jgi:ribosomal protein L37E